MRAPTSSRFLTAMAASILVAACAQTQAPTPDGGTADGGSATDEPALLTCLNRASSAMEIGDWSTARGALLEGVAIEPDLPALRLHAARAEAALGKRSAALDHLGRLATIGATADVAADQTLAPLRGQPEFAALADRLLANGAPLPAAEVIHRFADTELWPEGIALDPDTGDLFIGSIRRRAIYRLTPEGVLAELGTSADDGLLEVLGLWVDAPQRTLWAVTGIGEDEITHDGPPRVNEIVRYDLGTQRLDRRYRLPDDEHRLANDVVVGPDGTAWITESFRGELYRVPPLGELELFLRDPELVYLNGIALSRDGRRLYIGHYGGLSLVSIEDGSVAPVRGTDMALGMIDGLGWTDDGLVLVQNSRYVNNRVVRVVLSPDGRRAVRLDVLRSGLPPGLIPYTCAVDGDAAFVVAGAPFEHMDEPSPPPAPAVVRVPLG